MLVNVHTWAWASPLGLGFLLNVVFSEQTDEVLISIEIGGYKLSIHDMFVVAWIACHWCSAPEVRSILMRTINNEQYNYCKRKVFAVKISRFLSFKPLTLCLDQIK